MDPQSRKRPRPVVSCLRCRDKKLKCDRLNPCQNCTKTGNGCIFESAPPPKRNVHLAPESNGQSPHASTNTIIPATGPGIGIIEDLQQRMLKLEKLLAVKSAPTAIQPSWPERDLGTTNEDPPYLGTLVVKGERSRWHGMNDRITLLNQFAEAKTFINQSLKDPSLVGLAKEVQFLQSRSQTSLYSPESLSDLEKFPELHTLLGSLPSKEICDRLLHVYTSNFEKSLRILHIPSFYQHYATFWTTTDHDPSFLSMFIPLLTAVLSISVMIDTEPYVPEYASSWEYLKHNAVSSVKAWNEKLPRKSRTDFSTVQVGVLLLLARQLRLAPAEELWRESGSLVRSGMVMGLHIDTNKSPEISAFQAEMRRRLWVTIVELDLQTSMAAGMPMMTPALNTSSLIPSNLDDKDFGEASTELPFVKSLDEETDTLSLILLARSLTQRIRMMDLTQHTSPQENMEERLKKSRNLAETLSQIPHFLKPEYQTGHVDRASTLNIVLLDIHLRRPLLCLLRPVTSSKNHDDPSFPEIQRLCLESSMAILSYQDLFDPNLVDLDTPDANAYWNVFQNLFQNDILWAAVGVCEYLKLVNHQASIQFPSTETLDDNSKASNIPASHSIIHNKAGLIRLVENTLETLTRRIGEKGTNMKDVLLLSVVLQSVRSRGPSDQKQGHMSQGARKALSACRSNLLSAANEVILPSYFGMEMVCSLVMICEYAMSILISLAY